MVKLSVRDLIDLVASGATAPEARLERVFEWSHSRRLELVKWLLTAAVALFAPVAIAFLRGELGTGVSPWWVGAAVFASVFVAITGMAMLFRARQAYRTYLAAQALLGEIRKVAPFLERYRQEAQRR